MEGSFLCEMSKSAKATKLALSLPRDEKGKFLPRGSKNLFKKKVKRNNKTHKSSHKNGRKRRKTSHGSHLGANNILELLNPIKDVISLLAPLLGGSHTKAHTQRQKNFQTLITGKAAPKKMAKRRRKNNNNNNGDIFPNFLTGSVTQTTPPGADTFATILVNTPIPRIQTTRSGQKATVMELLWIEWLFPAIDVSGSLSNITAQFVIGTVPTLILDFNNPRVFAEKRIDTHLITSGSSNTIQPLIYNMQSMDGHGYLLAAESFHVSIFSVNTNALQALQWRLYYRFIDIPLSEFIGLVQSTQQ